MIKILKTTCTVMILSVLAGCANDAYQANMKYRDHRAMWRSQSQQSSMGTVMKAVSAITGGIEAEVRAGRETPIDGLIKGIKVTDSNMGMILLARVASSISENQSKVEIARAKAQTIQYLQPIVASIYQQLNEKLGTPPTWQDVALRVVDNIPIMTTALGMYGVAATMADHVGERITANMSDSSKLNVHSMEVQNSAGAAANMGSSGSTVSPTTTTTTTTDSHDSMAEPEAEPEPKSVPITAKELFGR